jgi:hypothetical protein
MEAVKDVIKLIAIKELHIKVNTVYHTEAVKCVMKLVVIKEPHIKVINVYLI